MSREPNGLEPGRVELEPVTCWPLILAAGGFVAAGVSALAGFALWGALQPRPQRQAPRAAPAVVASPTRAAVPDALSEAEAPPVAFRPARQVIVRRVVEPEFNPAVRVRETAKKPSGSWAEGQARRFTVSAPQAEQRAAVAPTRPRWETPTRLMAKANLSPDSLRRSLWEASREIDLTAVKGAGKKLYDDGLAAMKRREKTAKKEQPALTQVIRDFIAARDELRGLPLTAEDACQSSEAAVKCLARVSRAPRVGPGLRRRAAATLPEHYGDPLVAWLATSREGLAQEPLHVGPLVQVCEVESEPARQELVTTLGQTKGEAATRALAARAAFDLSPAVRQGAIAELKRRSLDEARPVLLAALRHPWAPAADHAALALVELNDQKASGGLEKMLEGPDPCRPFKDGEGWQVRELVRVNHLRNCLLCHPPSSSRSDLVTGPIPTPGKRLPEIYYSGRGSAPAVRADIVYLRQDFSAVHPVEKAAPWPAEQRFDYLVRTRQLAAQEANALLAKAKGPSSQREAVRAVLAELKRRKEYDRGK